MINRPKTMVAIADQRNHHIARQVSLSSALFRAAASISAYEGTCTKLKNHSRPIHMIATMTWAMRKAPHNPARVKISIDNSNGPANGRAERTKVCWRRQGRSRSNVVLLDTI